MSGGFNHFPLPQDCFNFLKQFVQFEDKVLGLRVSFFRAARKMEPFILVEKEMKTLTHLQNPKNFKTHSKLFIIHRNNIFPPPTRFVTRNIDFPVHFAQQKENFHRISVCFFLRLGIAVLVIFL